MFDSIHLHHYLRDTLQQAMHLTQAQSGVVFLEQPSAGRFHLEIALPDMSAVHEDLAQQAIKAQQLVKSQVEDSWFIYLPLTAYDTALGALGFRFAEETLPDSTEALLHMISSQTAVLIASQRLLAQYEDKDKRLAQDHRLLLTIYEALPLLDAEDDPTSYVQNTAQTFLSLGWSPVRISLHNPKVMLDEPISLGEGADRLPNLTSAAWDAQLERATKRMGDAYFIPQEGDLNLLLIRVNTSKSELLASIELYQDAALPAPSEQNIRPLVIYARQFGNAIDRTILFRSLRQTADLLAEQIDELEFMRRADREISSRLDPDRIVKFTLDWALRRTVADAGAIVVIDPKSEKLTIRETLGFPQAPFKELDFTDPPYQGIVGRSLRERRTQVIEDVESDPEYLPILPDTLTQLAIPLISNKRLIGAITLESRTPGRFDSDAVSFLERIVSMTAIALDNAYLLRQAEQLADDMSLIYNAGRTISSSLEWGNTIQSIAQGMALAVRGSNALIYSFEEEKQSATLLSAYTTSDQARLTTQVLPQIGSTLEMNRFPLFLQVMTSNKMITLDEHSEDSNEKHWLQGLEATAAGITPLTAQGNIVGLAVLIKTIPGAQFASSEIFVAESLATQAAALLRQASLYSEVLELEKLKSEMIRMASHDLRAPIANVLGYIELLDIDLAHFKTPDMESYLDSIKRSVSSMEALVEDLLTLEKVESHRSETWQIIELTPLVSEVIEAQETAANLKHHHLSLDSNADDAKVRGNRTQIRQAIMNLVSNGIKYTPNGGSIHTKAYTTDEDRGRFYFQVSDTGYGIPESRQGRIFERFYRAKQAGTEGIPGTGLGLSLVKSIIDRHGGKIWFESEEGKGSTFFFWLPLAHEES